MRIVGSVSLFLLLGATGLNAQVRSYSVGIMHRPIDSGAVARKVDDRRDHKTKYTMVGGAVGAGIGLAIAGVYVSRSPGNQFNRIAFPAYGLLGFLVGVAGAQLWIGSP